MGTMNTPEPCARSHQAALPKPARTRHNNTHPRHRGDSFRAGWTLFPSVDLHGLRHGGSRQRAVSRSSRWAFSPTQAYASYWSISDPTSLSVSCRVHCGGTRSPPEPRSTRAVLQSKGHLRGRQHTPTQPRTPCPGPRGAAHCKIPSEILSCLECR